MWPIRLYCNLHACFTHTAVQPYDRLVAGARMPTWHVCLMGASTSMSPPYERYVSLGSEFLYP